MGEYFKLSNVTKKQNIHPHTVGEGLKFGEWVYLESNVIKCALELYARGAWELGDEIRIVSDYGSSIHLLGPDSGIESTYDRVDFVNVHFEGYEREPGSFWTRDPDFDFLEKHDPLIFAANIIRVRRERGYDD